MKEIKKIKDKQAKELIQVLGFISLVIFNLIVDQNSTIKSQAIKNKTENLLIIFEENSPIH